MIRALHTKTYSIGRNNNKSAVSASAYRGGCSVVAAAAYRANDKIKSESDGRIHNYTHKRGVVFSRIILPTKAPERFKDRATLWNEVERIENRKNSQFARQWEASFPAEFNRNDQIAMLMDFVQTNFTSQGMIADVSVHDVADRVGGRNIHTHILLTLRRVDENGFIGNKVREWNDYQKGEGLVQKWREDWARRCNVIYHQMEIPTRIDPRSYKIQQNGLIPTNELGKAANQLEKQGIRTRKGDENRRIKALNEVAKQNSLYDTFTRLVDQPDSQPKEEEKNVDGQNQREISKIRASIRVEKGVIDDLQEIKDIVAEMEQQLVLYQREGDTGKVAQIEQSLAEVRENLMAEYGVTPVELDERMREAQENLDWNEVYLRNISSDEKIMETYWEPSRESEKEKTIQPEEDHERERDDD